MKIVKGFKQLCRDDVATAGGKGASLGEMTQAGISVPPGFVILSDVFERFTEEADINSEIDAKLHKVNHNVIHTVEEASEKIQSLILSTKIPKDIVDEVQKEFKKLNTKYVAVRSSATAEDSFATAWAGQLDSFLNTTEEILLENVRKCWASLFTPRAIFYRFEQNLHKQKISVAVVVQKMVKSEISGIAFSVHPITQDRNHLIVEAGFGLGEAIVSGSITPDGYVVEKKQCRILEKKIGEQKTAIVRCSIDGSKKIRVSSGESNRQKLPDCDIVKLSKIIIEIERHYGFPVDIEWAKEKGIFYIVQSRPITTLTSQVRRKAIYKKSMNRSMSVMDCQYWYLGEKEALPKVSNNAVFFEPLFVYSRGMGVDVYYNHTDVAQDEEFLVEHFSANINEFYVLAKQYEKDCNKITKLAKRRRTEDFSTLFLSVVDFWGKLAVVMILGELEKNGANNLQRIAYNLRAKYDGVLYEASESLLEMAKQKIPAEYVKYVEFLTFEEIKSGRFPEIKELIKRTDGHVFFKGNISAEQDLGKFARIQNLQIVGTEHGTAMDGDVVKINGSGACDGRVKGVVRVIFEYNQLEKIKNGDVLVTPMTTPDFLPAMERAVAFITDEGGIMCHAAIVAREINKPCVIGTKFATEILKDGDLVEVDGDNGVVTVFRG